MNHKEIMKKLLASISILIVVSLFVASAQNKSFELTRDEIITMNSAIKADTNLSRLIGLFGKPADLYKQYKINLWRADSIWRHDQQAIKKLKDIGTTRHFEMIPLIDWFTSDENFIGEAGVSYLIKTDEATILFDLGENASDEDPSPLMRNMARMGIKLGDIDLIVISHNHGDHVGGDKWAENNTFSLTSYQLPLKQIPAYTPVEMTYPGLNPVCTPLPTKIARGVATIGVIHNPVFFTDIGEQAIAVNVENKGIIIISGCGHQSIEKILLRAETLFDEPIYGILGGFHYPMEETRNITWIYKYVVVGKLPWERLTVDEIRANCELLKARNIKLVGLSAHDSSDGSVAVFKQEFPDAFVNIRVGETISLNN
jgi:7,8-dihydropterin-6-yl-methyl-4-(beta-D-ribofuranosyl)aminobenzene 5'-phosphate synthase